VSERLYFRQWLAGRDFAADDAVARQMVNFVYAIGDLETGEAVLVDPAYRPDELVALLGADGLRVTGVLATHYHPDHVGGDLGGHAIAGLAELLEVVDVPVHVNAAETPWVTRVTGVGADVLVAHEGDDRVSVGAVEITLVHTPGHTPGSQCFLVDGRLVSGDTLFLDGCGRTDLPGSDPEEMYRSLHERLARIDATTELFPGHRYSSAPSASLGDVRRTNRVLAPSSPAAWLAVYGG
jgi:glyoxylase-like metal-dependent hydrolase (beta-lactamase superfamily II)